MTRLAVKTPCAGLLPVKIGGLALTEEDPGHLATIAPYRGRDDACSAALEAAHGMAMPGPNRTTAATGAQAVWFGQRMALLVGPLPDPALARHAALTDQSDAWVVARLDGAGARDVLARVTPLDLRDGVFGPGDTARSDLAHMAASVTRIGPEAFRIMVFRSCARSFVHEMRSAMEGVAARVRL